MFLYQTTHKEAGKVTLAHLIYPTKEFCDNNDNYLDTKLYEDMLKVFLKINKTITEEQDYELRMSCTYSKWRISREHLPYEKHELTPDGIIITTIRGFHEKLKEAK